mmetsp:Transcript_16418/g.27818  ORF Transcript_16418/g.27818 Transcript_16418/m.27818 type:complete len:297 (+) Transcript_16418:371-1261(+)
MSTGLTVLFVALFLIIFGVIAYKTAEYYFKNDKRSERIVEMRQLIRLNKKQLKGKLAELDSLTTQKETCKKMLNEENEDHQIDLDIKELYLSIQEHEVRGDSLEDIIELERKLKDIERDYHEKQGFKWYSLFFSSLLVGIFLYYVFIPSINLAFVVSSDNDVFLAEIQKIIPAIPLADVSSNDFLAVSWDMNGRQPYMLTKQTISNNEEYSVFDSLDKAALVSACNPLYFKPYTEGDRVMISGNAFAESPAMLAFLYATEVGQDPSNINVVSVGSLLERSVKIPSDIGVIDWVSRI